MDMEPHHSENHLENQLENTSPTVVSTNIMGNFCCFDISVQDRISYQIVLKAPNGSNMQYIDNGIWKYEETYDINQWVKQLYDHEQFTDWIVYNDELNNRPIATCHGHCKGIVAWNTDYISWLIHSVPKFPEDFQHGKLISKIGEGELIYGQSFIYINHIPLDSLNHVLRQIRIMNPFIYISTINIHSSLYEDTDNVHICELIIHPELTHIAKSKQWNYDLYHHLSEKCGGQWKCETWIRGDECENTETVVNVDKVTWTCGSGGGGTHVIAYSNVHDHSKYACNNTTHTFVGDVNRMHSQFHRGGGGIIINNATINQLFNAILE